MCFLVVPAVAICSGLISAFGTGAGEGRTSLRAFATYIGTGVVEGSTSEFNVFACRRQAVVLLLERIKFLRLAFFLSGKNGFRGSLLLTI